VNAVLIAYDLPDFSDGDLRTLASRFRAVVQEVQRLREENALPNGAGISFSPGGDGGVLSLTQVPLGRAFGLATELASLLEAAGTTQAEDAPVRARIGVHYGQVLPYENAEGVARPTGLSLFDADGLAGDAEARRYDAVVVSGALIESAALGAGKLTASRFQEIAPLVTPYPTTIRRFVPSDAKGRVGSAPAPVVRGSGRPVDRGSFLAACTPAAGKLFTYLLDEAVRRDYLIYWGVKGFSLGAQLPGGAGRWTFAYGFPPDDFHVYFEEGAPWSSAPESAALRKELMLTTSFREAGRLTLKSLVDDASSASAHEAARRIFERVEESVRRASTLPMPNGPRLTDLHAAYATGNLIVYGGAGISAAAGLPTWPALAANLLTRLRTENASPDAIAEVDDLLKRGHLIDALSAIKHALGAPEFDLAVEKACNDKPHPIPEVAQAIATLEPKLRAVLTTNLDHFLERAFAGAWPALTRPPGDLASRRGYILKFHGTLFDRSTWVFSRDQYDRATFASPTTRDTLAALFRTCPILFVGCGLADDDLDQTFAAIRALSGDQPPVHFALVAANSMPPFRRKKLETAGLRLIEYDNADGRHAELPRTLRTLAAAP